MITAPLLAALLRRALPGLVVLDHALADGGLYPWFPDAVVGAGAPDALPEAERALLAGFRQRGGTAPLAGFDPVSDAALAAGAPEAWRGGTEHRLLVPGGGGASAFAAGPWIHEGPGAMVLARDAAPQMAERVMLVLGAAGMVERADLMLPDGRLPAVLPLLEEVAQAMAAEGGGTAAGWVCGLRSVSPRLATLTLLSPAPAPLEAVLSAGTLVLEREQERRRIRLLLGVLPARPLALTVLVRGNVRAPPTLFLDGARHPVARSEADAAGGMRLRAVLTPQAEAPTVLGLAATDPPGSGGILDVERLEIAPA